MRYISSLFTSLFWEFAIVYLLTLGWLDMIVLLFIPALLFSRGWIEIDQATDKPLQNWLIDWTFCTDAYPLVLVLKASHRKWMKMY